MMRRRRRPSFLRRLAVIALAVLLTGPLLTYGLGQINPFDPVGDVTTWFNDDTNIDPILTPQRLTHITTGDHTGGGHLYGQGIPCKSEFPASWTETKIATEIPLLAANDNLNWQTSRNGYETAEVATPDGLVLRLVVNPVRNEIVTAYPVNVPRNPCPRPANDNAR